jgi:hypothetical protein
MVPSLNAPPQRFSARAPDTAGRQRLGGITKAGDSVLRSTLIVGATALLRHVRNPDDARRSRDLDDGARGRSLEAAAASAGRVATDRRPRREGRPAWTGGVSDEADDQAGPSSRQHKIIYVDMDDFYASVEQRDNIPLARDVALAIRAKIKEITGLNASAGISYNNFLAKLASDQRKQNGQYVITPEMGPPFVEAPPVNSFHGIGPATNAKMNSLGLYTGLDMRNQTLEFMQSNFGKAGAYYYWISREVDDRQVRANRVRKSVGAENTFSSDFTDFDAMTDELQPLIDKVWRHCGEGVLEMRQYLDEAANLVAQRDNRGAISVGQELHEVSQFLLVKFRRQYQRNVSEPLVVVLNERYAFSVATRLPATLLDFTDRRTLPPVLHLSNNLVHDLRRRRRQRCSRRWRHLLNKLESNFISYIRDTHKVLTHTHISPHDVTAKRSEVAVLHDVPSFPQFASGLHSCGTQLL